MPFVMMRSLTENGTPWSGPSLTPRCPPARSAALPAFRWIGLDATHRRERAVTTFCLEAHVTYHREVREGDPLRFTTLLLGHDAKRIHYIHEMYHAQEGYLAATNELMSLHVSEATRQSAPMAAEILELLA